jgi:peroxiredoxin
MRSRFSLLIALVSVALSALACATETRGPASSAANRPGAAIGGAAGAVTVLDSEGRGATFSSVLGGRAALVSFWAPWCESCVRELPELERLSRAAAPCGAAVVGVAVGEKPASIAAYARARALTYPQLTDEPFTLADALGQRRIPATIVFDRAGRVVFAGDAVDARATSAFVSALREGANAASCGLR